jgi:hypothetical protein
VGEGEKAKKIPVHHPPPQAARLPGRMKDRIGDQREGSEWEPIKILLEGD